MAIGSVFIRSRPTMGMEEAINIRFTGDFQVVSSLMSINAIKRLIYTRVSSSRWKEIDNNMFIKGSNKSLSSRWISSSNSKIINLSTNKNILILKFTNINVTFMSSITKIKFIKEDVINHSFPLKTTSRMTLKGFQDWNNMSMGIKTSIKSFEIPRTKGIIRAKITLTMRRGRLLKSILNISKRNNKIKSGSKGKEELHARLGNA